MQAQAATTSAAAQPRCTRSAAAMVRHVSSNALPQRCCSCQAGPSGRSIAPIVSGHLLSRLPGLQPAAHAPSRVLSVVGAAAAGTEAPSASEPGARQQPVEVTLDLSGNPTPEALLERLQAAAKSGTGASCYLSDASLDALAGALGPQLPSMQVSQVLAVLEVVGRLLPPFINTAPITAIQSPGSGSASDEGSGVVALLLQRLRESFSSASPSELAQSAWLAGEASSGAPPSEAWLSALLSALSGPEALQELLGPQLSALLAGLASMGPARLTPQWAAAAAEEVKFQLVEFPGDLSATDVARMVGGMAELGMGQYMDGEFRRVLMKAVYGKTRSLEDKAAVDFALARLEGEGSRSMHYDPRWTHEELRWLPRSERDKRRIIKENWVRTQWGGYGSK